MTICETCGLKKWDADDLVPGDYVCTCDEQPIRPTARKPS